MYNHILLAACLLVGVQLSGCSRKQSTTSFEGSEETTTESNSINSKNDAVGDVALIRVENNPPPVTQANPHVGLESSATASSIEELLLFFPAKYPEGNWTPSGLQFEDIWFNAEDGVRLHGWYCRAKGSQATILISHGNAGHVASRAEWLMLLQSRMHVSTFIFDYRGYGRSEGKPTVEGALRDSRAARQQLCEIAGIRDEEMLLMGESLGGAFMVELAAESPPKGLILQSTFSSLKDLADFHYPRLSWLVPAAKLNSATRVREYRGPLLQSHGASDHTIPLAIGENLFASANEPKEFVAIPGADHNDWLTEEYLQRLANFIQRVNVGQK